MVQHREIIESYNEYLNTLPIGCDSIVNLLRDGNSEEALKLILHFSEGVSWLVDANRLLEQNGIENSLKVDRINEFLDEINNGLEIMDFLLVADIFEYEIKPFFENVDHYEILNY
ncbi:hypothetical protein [Lysinibacillus xylanilyticus]|uniref:hypothetical protein n=1 Tax=Lysinibacillus xylanilyticus TaxID=582475 RepID=UPI003D0943CA